MGVSAEAYARQLKQLLPRGSLWNLAPESWLSKLLLGLADELARIDARAQDLLNEWDPRTATETLDDWERVFGVTPPSAVAADRRIAIAAAVTARGGSTPAYFVAVATALGFAATVEERRTNLALRSQALDNATWSKLNVTVGADTVGAPDGTLTAETVTDNATSGQHYVSQLISGLVVGKTYTVSVCMYGDTLGYGYIQLGSTYALADIKTGVSDGGPGTLSVRNLGGGWWRIATQRVAAATTETMIAGVYETSGTVSYAGTGKTARIWGAQVELGSAMTTYIPTEGSTVTEPAASVWRLVVDLDASTSPYGVTETWFRSGAGRSGDRIYVREVVELEAIINAAKPAHTDALFLYLS